MLLMGAPCYLLGWASHAFTSCSREPCNPGVEGVAGGPLCESVHQMFREHLVCGGLPWGLRRERIRLQRGTPGWGRSPGGGNGNPLQYCCLENPDRGAWRVTVMG